MCTAGQAYPIDLASRTSTGPAAATRRCRAAGRSITARTWTCPEPGDGFIALPGWTKGYVWVNGFCLGRYWNVGPQRDLYLPWPLVRAGRNEIVVLEFDGVTDPAIVIRPNREP